MTAAPELLDRLSVAMWEAPLEERWRARALSETAQTVLLVLAFGTELEMDGLTGFLENRTGALLRDVTAAFARIGAHQTAAALDSVAAVLNRHGVTHAQLRADLDRLPRHTITSFDQAHDTNARKAADELDVLEQGLYLNADEPEPVTALLEAYAADHQHELSALLKA